MTSHALPINCVVFSYTKDKQGLWQVRKIQYINGYKATTCQEFEKHEKESIDKYNTISNLDFQMKKTRVEEILMNIIRKAANVTSFTYLDFLNFFLKF